jgi:hypothetical protein
LDQRAEPPFEWVISRICEEFNCLPSEALRELEESPFGLVMDIMEMRYYVQVKEQIDNAKDSDSMPKGALADLVYENYRDILRERKRG